MMLCIGSWNQNGAVFSETLKIFIKLIQTYHSYKEHMNSFVVTTEFTTKPNPGNIV